MNKVKQLQTKRKKRIRSKLKSVLSRPRIVVNRTNKHIYAQLIDLDGKLIAASSDVSVKGADKLTKTEKATLVGEDLAKKAKKAKVIQVTFDRGYYKYHGRVKALAEAARSNGLEL